jgi:cardiolipin synthase A/B
MPAAAHTRTGPLVDGVVKAAGVLAAAILALLALLGAFYFTKGTPIRRVRAVSGRAETPAPDEELFCEIAEEHLDTVLEEGNELEVLFDGDGVYPRLWEDLRAASELIVWQVFWHKPGRLSDELGEILRERARSGVTVLLLRDAYGSWGVPGEYWRALAAAGVEIADYRPYRPSQLYKAPQRSHARCVVIDGEIGYTGGFAVADEWLGDGRSAGQWRDTTVRFRGPAVRHLTAAFAANWGEATGELLIGEQLFPESVLERRGTTRAGLVYAAPSLGSTDGERLWALSLAAARESFYLTTAYFVPEPGMRAFLCRAARRGIDVRVLTPGAHTDKPSTWWAGRKHYEELLEAGVRLYEYRPTMVHAKTMVVDRTWAGVGSLNFDNRSLALNDEVMLVASDRRIAAVLHDRFLADIELADELSLDQVRHRGLPARLREHGWALVARLL